MKLIDLRKKIVINLIALGLLLLIFIGLLTYNFYEKSTIQTKINKIKSETAEIKNQAAGLQSRTTEAKKYKELWKKLTLNKKSTKGIKMDDVNATMAAIADKYTIINPSIKVALPETIKEGNLKRSTVNVLLTNANLTFSAVNDVKALAFIEEFLDALPGYHIITSLDIKKSKIYSTQDLVEISTGKGSGSITAKVDFFWYTYKELDPSEKKAEEVKPNLVGKVPTEAAKEGGATSAKPSL